MPTICEQSMVFCCAGSASLAAVVYAFITPAAVVVGVVIALVQRVREIERGEEDDARNY